MNKTIEEGSTIYSDIYTDEEGLTWNILIRQGGTISLFATYPGSSGHGVLYDTFDGQPPNRRAQKVIARLSVMVEGINALLAAVAFEVGGEPELCLMCENPVDGQSNLCADHLRLVGLQL